MSAIKQVLIPLIALLVLITGCVKKPVDPCLVKWECEHCTALFEKIQQNLHDPVLVRQLQECYDAACRK